MKKAPIPNLIIVFILFIIPEYIYSNDASFIKNLYTGNFYPISNNNISMLNEEINIKVEYDFTNSSPGHNQFILTYNCNYSFKNNSPEKQMISMGFPVHYNGQYATSERDEAHRSLQGNDTKEELFSTFPGMISFESMIDEKKVSYSRELFEPNPEHPDLDYDEVYVFTVEFQPYEQKHIVNNYKQYAYPLVFSPDPLSAPIGFNYILKTGQLWNKPINKAVINVDMDLSPVLFQLTKLNPEFSSISRKNNRFVINHTFSNFFPQQDIYIELQFTDIKNIDISQLNSEMKTAVNDRDMKKCLLFSNYAIHQGMKITDKIPYDLLRRVMYWGANFAYFEKEYWTAISLFKSSISYGIKEKVDKDFWFFPLYMSEYYEIPKELLITTDAFSKREQSDAPEYYAAYNIAASASLIAAEIAAKADKFTRNDYYIGTALKFLEIAYKINPKIIQPLINKDSDLDFLKQNNPDEFQKIFRK
ncbi:MAG: hypothetical protein JXR48_04870 [Candidatus Delongbacteria bacterium]|nr:hypothetical protein [Candidatus Delongbacteria bacterium]